MVLEDLVRETCWDVCSCSNKFKKINITDGYCSDLLSDVMANASPQSLWITIQTHENIVAVALLCDLGAVLISGGREIPAETIKRAEEEGVVLLKAQENTYRCAGMLYKLLEAEG